MAGIGDSTLFPNSKMAAAVQLGQSRFHSGETTGVTGSGDVVAPTTPVTFDLATVTATTLSGGNLTVTNTGTTSTDQGARVANTGGKTSGKWYYEIVRNTTGGGPNMTAGVGTTASTYTGIGTAATTGSVVRTTGVIYTNGATSGVTIGVIPTVTKVCIAVDLDNRMIWFRSTPAANWNNNVANNPATNVGGIAIPAGTMVPFVTFGGAGGPAGENWTANFGATVFSGTVPSGFTAGWLV